MAQQTPQTNDTEPTVRVTTAKRFQPKSYQDRDPESDTRKDRPESMMGVVVMVLILAVGAGGVMWYGPDQALDAAKELMKSKKGSAAEEPAEKVPDVQEKVTPQANRKHRDTEAFAIKKEVVRPVRTKAAVVPVEAPKPKPKLRTTPIQVGMDRQQLIELWGLPDMKTSSSQGGHLIENFAYASRSRPMQTVVLEDGLVVAAGTN
jgi:hypothetical protein